MSRANYKRLGDYIQAVKNKNTDLKAKELLGINIDKFFMPSVANVVGTDMSRYKTVSKNQFACNRMHVGRDYRIPVALSRTDEVFMVSPAYDVFEITDTEILNPEYLMMWFSRKEFDRNAWFYTDADVRGGLNWKAFCDMQLPIPSIEKQNAIIKEYNTVVNRIKLNEQLNQKLEETAQAIYKHWFVDFNFPDENGKPYKLSGGRMVWNEVLGKDIPEGWEVDSFTKVLSFGGGGTPSTTINEYWTGDIPFYTPGDLGKQYYCLSTVKTISELGLSKCSSKLYPKNTIFLTARGATVGGVVLSSKPMAMNQTCYAIWGDKNNKYFAHQLTIMTIKRLKKDAVGATFEALVTKDFNEYFVINPPNNLKSIFDIKVSSIYEMLLIESNQIQKLHSIINLILSKMSKL